MNNEKKISLIITKNIDNNYKVNLIRPPHPDTLPMPPSKWLKN
jgi:hypothetical protein